MIVAQDVGNGKVQLTYKGNIANPVWAASDGISIVEYKGKQVTVPKDGGLVGPANSMTELCRQAPEFFRV